MKIYRAFLFIFVIGFNFTPGSAQLSLDINEDSFSIYFNEIEIFRHAPDDPIFMIGKGIAEFQENMGNFIINDTILDEIPIGNITDVPISNETDINMLLANDDETIEVDFTLWVVDTGDVNQSVLKFSVISTPVGYNRIWMNVYGEPTEKVFGAGEQYTYFNLKGHSFPIWTSEQGIGRDDGIIAKMANLDGGAGGDYYTTYWPQASYLSSRIYSLMIDNADYLELNFENSDTNLIYAHNDKLTGTFLNAPTIYSLVPFVSQYIGQQPSLPDWIMRGAILGLEGGTKEIELLYNEAQAADVDVAGLWVQDWSGKIQTSFGYRVYWNWKWNETYYEGLDSFIKQLDSEGVKMLVYCNPHLINNSEMYHMAEDYGYFLTDADGNTFLQDFGGFHAGTLDLHNQFARNWYRDQLINNIINLGIYGWMADFGEYVSLDMKSTQTDLTPEELHNSYPYQWAQTIRDVLIKSSTEGSVVPFMRSGGLGSSGKQVLTWAGDQNVDFSIADGLASTIVAALSLSVSGMGLTHFDIGGYTTEAPLLQRTKELLLRSAEYAVFTPVMRTHLGNKPESNWQIFSSKDTLVSFSRLTKIHTRLLSYTKSIVEENTSNGTPVQRPMFLHYESDDGAWDIMYQYMYGPDLIVAPVIDKGQTEVIVYIPGGDNAEWIHLWNGIGGAAGPFVGPVSVTIKAPIGLPAVLYRNDSSFADLFKSIYQDFGPAPP